MTAEIIRLYQRDSRTRFLTHCIRRAYRLLRGVAEGIGWITIAGLIDGALT